MLSLSTLKVVYVYPTPIQTPPFSTTPAHNYGPSLELYNCCQIRQLFKLFICHIEV